MKHLRRVEEFYKTIIAVVGMAVLCVAYMVFGEVFKALLFSVVVVSIVDIILTNACNKFFKEQEKNSPENRIIEAEAILEKCQKILQYLNFLGKNTKKIQKANDKIEKILNLLKRDASGYQRVKSFIEKALPNYYKLISLYSRLMESGYFQEDEEKLESYMSNFLVYLEKQRIAIFYEEELLDFQFQIETESLIDELTS